MFKKFLKKVIKTYSNAPKIIMILDNVKYHHTKKLKEFLNINKKIELLYLPPYSSDLNPVERVWWFMRKSITHT